MKSLLRSRPHYLGDIVKIQATSKVVACSSPAGSRAVPSRRQIEEEEGTEAHRGWMTSAGYAEIQLESLEENPVILIILPAPLCYALEGFNTYASAMK